MSAQHVRPYSSAQPGKDLERAMRVRVDELLRAPPRPMESIGAAAVTAAVGAPVSQSTLPPSAMAADAALTRSSAHPPGSLLAGSSPQGQGVQQDRGRDRRAVHLPLEGMDRRQLEMVVSGAESLGLEVPPHWMRALRDRVPSEDDEQIRETT